MRTNVRFVNRLLTAVAFLGFLYPAVLAAQSSASGKKPTFDIRRFSPTPPGTFETFYVTETKSLRQALDAGTVTENMPVLVTETATGKLAFLTDQMVYHHIAQGSAGGKDWMVTF
ncbi:MAG: hypothetical protein HY646_10755 [Acidobacteria bacterium]|nr:hypothetical protein [Acidobacteriota bacterium]